ncbi:MAG: HAMP domain-containing histidine kinase, partial [Odoribacter sp.]|nr:HAMP domain-containing histidine kinase [Odoribacter sp.]
PYSERQEALYNELKERLDMMGGGIRRLLTHSVGLYGMHLEKSGVNLREMIERVVLQYRMISGKKIDMECDLDEICLYADPVHLSEAIANLVENAVKYTGENARIRVKCGVKGKYVYIVVADNGPGIPEKEMHRIFRKYYRASGSQKGFGLGLNYVWKVVAAHNGKIEVKNKSGCEFTIILPWKKG